MNNKDWYTPAGWTGEILGLVAFCGFTELFGCVCDRHPPRATTAVCSSPQLQPYSDEEVEPGRRYHVACKRALLHTGTGSK